MVHDPTCADPVPERANGDYPFGSSERAQRARSDVRNLICSIGQRAFETELVRCLHDMYGADNIYIFHLPGGRPQMLKAISHDGSPAAERLCDLYFGGRMWLFDPSMDEGSSCSSVPLLRHLNTKRPETNELREFYSHQHVRERVVVSGAGADGASLALSIVRSARRGAFSGEQQSRLELLPEILFPLLVKHRQVHWEHRQLLDAVTCLPQIERCLSLAPEKIPRREIQVVARILYGLTATGIALDLGIGRETVITHRKTFYKRLMIAGFHDLLLWYLRLYSDVGRKLIGSPQAQA